MKTEFLMMYVKTEDGSHIFEDMLADKKVSVPVELVPTVMIDAVNDEEALQRWTCVRVTLEAPVSGARGA